MSSNWLTLRSQRCGKMADRDGVIWFDGEMVAWREAKVHVLTHTLHYGMGCFEGVRAYHADQGTAIFALQAHTRRLMDSCKILGMELPYSEQQLVDAQIAAVRENKLESAYIRPMCFLGSEGMGLRADNLSVHCIVAAKSHALWTLLNANKFDSIVSYSDNIGLLNELFRLELISSSQSRLADIYQTYHHCLHETVLQNKPAEIESDIIASEVNHVIKCWSECFSDLLENM